MNVTLKNVTKIFPSRDKSRKYTTAVSDFSYEIPDGTLCCLLGPSGCGKSTTLNMISGLEAPTSGQILFGEIDVTRVPAESRGIGLVFQNYALYPHLSVLQNITFPLENLKGSQKLSKEEMKERAIEAAKLVQMENYLERKPGQLSGGQQQRVAIARALVKMPRVLLLDEPLSNLDARLRLQTREEIKRIQKTTGITTIFVTHDQEEAMSISDLILVMKKAVLMQAGKPQEVYNNPNSLFVAKFLGTPAINVFEGRIENGALYIGAEKLSDAPDNMKADRKVYVGIRPEGLLPDEDGVLTLNYSATEVLGRDISIVSTHESCISGNIRAIINSETVFTEAETVKFRIVPSKIYVFDCETEERLF